MAKITTGTKSVTAAGTAERLVTVANNLSIRGLSVTAKQTNTGLVYVGASDVASTTERTPGRPRRHPGHRRP